MNEINNMIIFVFISSTLGIMASAYGISIIKKRNKPRNGEYKVLKKLEQKVDTHINK